MTKLVKEKNYNDTSDGRMVFDDNQVFYINVRAINRKAHARRLSTEYRLGQIQEM